jgi:hypothetical protein
MSGDGGGFLSRWSRRKVSVREGRAEPELAPPAAEPARPAQVQTEPPPVPPVPAAPEVPAPTLEDVDRLERGAEVSRFMAPEVDPQVKNAALKKLFADPQFNVMDGLDTYIDDYGKPDPIPESMLRKMVQSQLLGLFADDDAPENPGKPAENDPDPAVRLQPDDGAGPAGPGPGPGEDAGRER